MNKLFTWSFTVALAGLLFGFDTAVIAGVDQTLESLWNSSKEFHGTVVIGMALWGTVIGAIFGGIPSNKFGRKNTLIGVGILFFVSALGSALANDPYVFAAFRFIGGIGVGASTIAAPAYIAELSPAAKRGRLVAMYQLSIVLGIVVAFSSNYVLRNMGENAWRWMVGVECIPALIYCVLVFMVPKSPRWLLMQGRDAEAEEVLARMGNSSKLEELKASLVLDSVGKSETIFTPKYKKALGLVFFIAFFNQFSGINAFIYYGNRIFESAGLGESAAFLSTAGLGIVNAIFTLVGMALIDRLGRRQLLYIGSFGYIISLVLASLSISLNWGGLSLPLFLFLFIASHAIGQGAVIWVFIAELFPNHLRASGQAFGSSVHWVLAALIPSSMPYLFEEVGTSKVFGFFALMMVGQLIWVHFKMPETKGVSLEDLSRKVNE